ncbi:MAG: ATP-binding protein [Muribaculaceae bacterium]|nr:ATP-binding protein [Muribaculaceae bacterium]
MRLLRRKIDEFLVEWKKSGDKKPLIVRGARQIGKTESISAFGRANYRNFININFILQERYKTIFDDGYEVDTIVKNLSLINGSLRFVPGETLIFFDEIQACSACATCLKAFAIDGRFDVICSGSLMGINYNEIESVSVGYKQDHLMHGMDFEEFLWARGFSDGIINGLFEKMLHVEPLGKVEMDVLMGHFKDYMITGGMPAVVSRFVENGNFSGVLQLQRRLLKDYEEDITKYAIGLDKGKVKNIYNHISVFLGKDNKKYQISKIARGARNRDYVGTVEWLADAGIINVCYGLENVDLPLKGNYNPSNYKLYYSDTGLLVASLEEEAQEDLRVNRNFNTYKGAIYENVVANMLVKQGYDLYFYRNEKSTIEMDFFVRDISLPIPVEVKATNAPTRSLNKLVDPNGKFTNVKYGIKLCSQNIGFNGLFYTFPYFLTFFLKRFLKERGQE